MKKARRQQADKNASGRGGWVKKTLAQIGDISSAGVDKKIVAGEKEVVLLNYLDVYRRDKIYASELTHKVTAPHAKAQKCAVKKGDIFFTPSSEIRVDIAHSAVAMEDIKNGVYSYHIIRLRPKIKIDLLFSAYAFKARGFCKQAAKHACGAGQRYVISQENFRRMEVYLPSFSVQKRIGEVLHTCDDAIKKTESLIAAKERRFNWLLHKLIGSKNADKSLGSMCLYEKGEKQGKNDAKLGYLEIGDIDIATKNYCIDGKQKKPVPDAVKVPANTLLISTVRSTRGAITKTQSEIYVSSAFCRLKIENDFCFYSVQQSKFFNYLKAIESGGTYPTVKDKDILAFKTSAPPKKEQAKIVRILSTARQEILLLNKLAEQYRLQKRGLMQKLLSEEPKGKIATV